MAMLMLCDWKLSPLAAEGRHPALEDPWEAALRGGPGLVLALLTATQGPSYRDPGAAMAIFSDGRFAGAVTSGCVEADLILRAEEVRASGIPQRLRYGAGSPFMDLRLPCGGAAEVSLFPLRDRGALFDLSRARAERRAVALEISPQGDLGLGPWRPTGPAEEGFVLGFPPALRFLVFGAGPEAAVFARLLLSLDYDHLLISHEEESLNSAAAFGCRTRPLRRAEEIAELDLDARCSAALFYHDHDYEPEILSRLLETPAFYIGAQGSRSAQRTRLLRLAEMGVTEAALSRLRGPIGLVPSARDPQTLAISVLAEILAAAPKA